MEKYSDAAAILRMLASSDVGILSAAISNRALELGIEAEALKVALIYASENGWIENGLNDTVKLTAVGRTEARTLQRQPDLKPRSTPQM